MSQNNSKPIYLSGNKYPLLEPDLELTRGYQDNQENDEIIESCFPSLNNKEKITNFWLCFVLGNKLNIKFISFFFIYFKEARYIYFPSFRMKIIS